MIAGLLLALGSAALINLGFLLQHRALRGLQTGTTGARTLRRALRKPGWLAGQALGWIGFLAQIVAVALAPLSLVQAFAAGGLALSVPIAASSFGLRIDRAQTLAVLAIAAGLAALPLGLPATHEHLHDAVLILTTGVSTLVALAVAVSDRAWARAIAAGCFYGVADAAIKAVSLGWARHGLASVLSPWAAVAAVETFGGFLCFQSALGTDERAVASISLMNALAAIVALVSGVAAFGESLGTGSGVRLGHLAAIALVLCCVPVLAAAQSALADGPASAPARERRPGSERERLHQRAEARRA
ncbi:MAG: hypothetical protein ACYCXW_07695 [Solirubrobacteraceae bacterium]